MKNKHNRLSCTIIKHPATYETVADELSREPEGHGYEYKNHSRERCFQAIIESVGGRSVPRLQSQISEAALKVE
jgi:hypothetical protein